MPFFDPIRIGASGAADTAYTVDRGLRFNDNDGAYLQETAGTPTNNKIWTYSVWVKRTTLSGDQAILVGYSNGGSFDQILFSSSGGRDNQLFMQFNNSGTYGQFTSTRVFRDVGAWGHLVIKADTTAGSNGITVYWNNEVVAGTWNVTLAQDATFHSLNQSGDNFRIGHLDSGVANHYLDGYLAEINFVDGSALLPSSFGETNVSTGQWNPKKYVSAYGTNGFYLNFSDNSGTTATTLGKDSSGNGNNFTPSNFVTGDSMPDSPTNNFCVMSPIDKSTDSRLTVTDGNLKVGTSHGFRTARATFGLSSGKWYWEARLITWASSFIGITDTEENITSTSRGGENSNSAMIRQNNGDIRTGGSNSSYGNSQSNGDILGFALDMDNGKFYISENGTFYNSGDPVNGTNPAKSGLTATVSPSAAPYDNKSCYFNFGQDDTFDGNETSQGNTDGNGFGKFKYAPPTGFLTLCSANLPDPTIKLPNNHFNTILYTGDDSDDRDITGVGFQPDWLWIKNREGPDWHQIIDSVRGANKTLFANETDGENTDNSNGHVNSFLADGFNVSALNSGNVNENNEDYVAWNWNAGDTDGKTYTVTVVSDSGNKYRFDGFGTSAVTLDLAEGGTYIFDQSDSSNSGHPLRFYTAADKTGGEYTTGVTTAGTAGSSGAYTQIVVAASAPTLYYQCSVHAGMGGQVNTNSTLGSSNFDGAIQSVVKASPTAGFSIINYTGTGSTTTAGHGLGVAPVISIRKVRNTGADWFVHHTLVDGSMDFLKLNTTASNSNSSLSAFTSTVFPVDDNTNQYIIYCFSEVSSYSKFGSYVGNGSTDGTFVFTGFRPAWFMAKETSSTSRWSIYDNKRDTNNPNEIYLRAQANNADTTSINNDVDFLSNGVKMRGTGEPNASGISYIFLAFASSPFKNARAR